MTEGSSRSGGDIRSRIVDDYSGYKIYDRDGGKLGKVEYTVLDEREQPQYLAVKTGLFGSKTTLIPERVVRLDEGSGEFQVEASEDQIKDAPTFGDEDEIPQDFEDRVMNHYGLGASGAASSGATTQDRDYSDRGSDEARSGYAEDTDRTERGLQSSELGYGERETAERGERTGEGRRDEGRDYDERGYDDRGYDDRDREGDRSGGAAAAGAAGGAAAAGAARSGDRDYDREGDRESGFRDSGETEHRRGDETERASSGSDEREQIRVTLKREEARAERFINEHGEEEVRIRKTTVREEKLVDVEDKTR